MIDILFGFSFVGNLFLLWYIVQLLRRFLAFQDDLDGFVIKLEEYEKHIEMVHNLERFYGDETLGKLLRHSKAIVEDSKQFASIFELDEDVEEEEYGEEA